MEFEQEIFETTINHTGDSSDDEDIPELESVENIYSHVIASIDDVYSDAERMTKSKEIDRVKKMAEFIYTIADQFDGTVDFSCPFAVFLRFPSKGLKKENVYNFYFDNFESKVLRMNNASNLHQKYAMVDKTEEEFDALLEMGVLVDLIHEYISTIPLSEVPQCSPQEYNEYTSPF